MKRQWFTGLTGALALTWTATPAIAAPGDDLNSLIDDYWQYALSQSPVFASSLDVSGYEGKVSEPGLEAQTNRVDKAQDFLIRLEAID
ncbi:MAG: hypothetical protein AAGH53_06300 [Pseudomonadota bacterium]